MKLITKNGISLTSLTLGTVQLGVPYGIANRSGMPDEARSRLILETALGGGVVSYDTAQGYGGSETVLGNFLPMKQELTLITKIVIQAEASLTELELERTVIGQVEISLDRLKISRIPILMLHHASDILRYREPLVRIFERLMRDGYARKAGASFGADPTAHSREIWSFMKQPVFEALQVPINLLDQRLLNSGLLDEMRRAGKIVFARSIFLQGLMLLEHHDIPSNLQTAERYINQLRLIADREGVTITELAVAYVRDMPGVDSLVIGAETSDQVAANINLMRAAPISERTRYEILKLTSDVPELIISPQLWGR